MTLKWIEQKREYRQVKARVAALPASWQTAFEGITRYLTHLGGMSDGDAIVTMFDDLVTLFEQAAADGTRVRDVVGADPVEFVDAFMKNYPAGNWIARERERLARAIDEAEDLDIASNGTSS